LRIPRAENPSGGPPIRVHRFTHRPARLLVAGAALAITATTLMGVAHPAAADSGRYQVRNGDTLSQVALDHGVSAADLARVNGIDNRDRILAGTWLTIPAASPSGAPSDSTSAGNGGSPAASTTYTVMPGDNLIGIAARFGFPASTLAFVNGLPNQDLVRSGTTLQIPAAAAPTGDDQGASAPAGGGVSRVVTALQGQGRYWLSASMQRWAGEYGVPVDLLSAMTYLESGWQSAVVSSTGAIGIGQLMPDTISYMQGRIGISLDPYNPDDNTRMTAAFLRILLDETGWNPSQALAAYYQGLNAVRTHGFYEGTQTYVNGVLALRSAFA